MSLFHSVDQDLEAERAAREQKAAAEAIRPLAQDAAKAKAELDAILERLLPQLEQDIPRAVELLIRLAELRQKFLGLADVPGVIQAAEANGSDLSALHTRWPGTNSSVMSNGWNYAPVSQSDTGAWLWSKLTAMVHDRIDHAYTAWLGRTRPPHL